MTGFYLHTKRGTSHVNGDPNMSDETANALAKMIDLASEQFEEIVSKSRQRQHESHCYMCRQYRERVSELVPVRKLKRSRIGRKFVYTFREDRKVRKKAKR